MNEGAEHVPDRTAEWSAAALDVICRNALQLLDAAHEPPARLRIEADGMCVELEWSTVTETVPVAMQEPSAVALATAAPTTTVPTTAALAIAAPTTATPGEQTGFSILASTVGTFYHAPQPGAAPFVRAGDEVKAGQPVGILEVMKLMIPVEADRPGRVAEILVPDGSPVEYGQPLIACTPPETG